MLFVLPGIGAKGLGKWLGQLRVLPTPTARVSPLMLGHTEDCKTLYAAMLSTLDDSGMNHAEVFDPDAYKPASMPLRT